MVKLSDTLHLISDAGNALLLLYALFIEGDYSIPFLILVVLILGIKLMGDLLE